MSSPKFGAQPRANEPVVGRDGLVTQAWRDYFARLAMAQSSDDLRQLYEALAARVAELADGQSFRVIGRNSVTTSGTSVVEIQLLGDEDSPGNTEYYGTGPTGQRGFFPVADAIAVDTGELEKSVGTDGVITLGLADVPNSGTGTLQALTVDGKGRVTGTKAATITGTAGNITVANGDAASGLPTINLATVADSGTGSLLAFVKDTFGRVTGTKAATITGTAQQINVANGNAAAGLPTLSLAPEVLAALEEAVTALQPGDIPVHNDLSWLQGGASGEYYHLTSAQYSGLTPWSTIAPSSKANDSAVVHNTGTENIAGAKTFSSTVTVRSSNAIFFAQTVGGVEMLFAANDVNSTGYIGTGSNHSLGFYANNVQNLRLLTDRNVIPGSDNVQSFGRGADRWKELFAATGTINTSDAREKTPVRPFTPAELAAAAELGREIGAYQWLAMVEEKGEAARQHIGMTVQGAIATLESHGLDPFAYGFICYDEWDELPEILGDGGEIVQEYRPAGDRYSFRMDELLAFIARGMAHRLDSVEQRLAAAGL